MDLALVARPAWGKVVLLIGAGITAAFQIGKVPLALAPLQEEFGFGLATAGWVVALFAIMGACTAIVLSFWVKVFGLKSSVLLGLSISCVAGLLGAMAPTTGLLLLSRACEGLGFVLTVLAVPPLVTLCAPKGQGATAMAYWGIYLPTGACLMLIVSALLLDLASWRMIWVITALAQAAAAICIAQLKLPPPEVAHAQTPPIWAYSPAQWAFIGILAGTFGLYAAQYFVFASFLPKIFSTNASLNAYQLAQITAAFIALNAVGNFTSGLLHQVGVPSWWLICITALALLMLAPLILTDSEGFGIRILAAVVFSFLSGLTPSSLFASTTKLPGPAQNRAFLNACLVQGSSLGQLVGTPLVALVVARSGHWADAVPIIWGMALAIFVAGLAIGILGKRLG